MMPVLEETQNLYLNKDSSFRENKGLQLIKTTIAKVGYTAKVPSSLFFSRMCSVHSMFYNHLVFLLSSPCERVKLLRLAPSFYSSCHWNNVAASEFYRLDKTYDLKLSRQWMQAILVLTTLGYQSSFENQNRRQPLTPIDFNDEDDKDEDMTNKVSARYLVLDKFLFWVLYFPSF
ncbi:uncharacterized protein LOC111397148 [Olea europaea var. sylvestris]|uniref:uncharacterized protein LOC111397148 n=1 Tax=Olea europaea var. sylvestris TaxID=158386 RepID=UPI000C1D6C55|nr:uncharacterized protein LOC111397148 [Olea europaea var. sylvestris]